MAGRNGLAGIGPEFLIPRSNCLTVRNHSNAPSIARHHTLAEERAFIVPRSDSVPVGISIVVPVSRAVHEPVSNEASSVEAAAMGATAMEVATASTMKAAAPETAAPEIAASEIAAPEIAALGRSQVCAGCSEGG
jgi:hypothetical protein